MARDKMCSETESKPEVIYEVINKKSGLRSYLVIDSTVGGKSCGGVRMLSDITLDEVCQLAKTMTLKYGFLGMPRTGGAKAGIAASSTLSPERKLRILRAFGRELSPVIKSRRYIPAADMGTTYEDIVNIMQGAGRRINPNRYRERGKSAYYTALSVFASAKVAIISLGLKLPHCTVAVEGLGKVGISVADLFASAGAKVVAVSTVEGAIFNPHGLGVNKLAQTRNRVGDRVVNVYQEAEKISKGDLLRTDVDVLVPCARPWTINSRNANEVMAKMIVPAANIPVTEEAERILLNNGKLYLPCFVTNAGGVLGLVLQDIGFSDSKIKDIILEEFSRNVIKLLQFARTENITITNLAKRIAEKRFLEMKAKRFFPSFKDKSFQLASDIYKRGLFPREFISPFSAKYVINTLRSTEQFYHQRNEK